ncbi:hypothetical protein L2E82_28245 [Cichorium intybus]|uniref:Uncharacterized protein n=1 Tax=Cichorium intybus TaxID=13427 RepID=A0ACB9CVW1_CICIN|nr:hypothetical protein L2E82_28245 [Cichorium intybus]
MKRFTRSNEIDSGIKTRAVVFLGREVRMRVERRSGEMIETVGVWDRVLFLVQIPSHVESTGSDKLRNIAMIL